MNAILSGKPSLSPEFKGKAAIEGDPLYRLIESARINDVRGMQHAVLDGANKYATGTSGENVYTAAADGNALSAIDYAAAELRVHIDMADNSGRTGLLTALQKIRPQAAAKFLVYGANPLEVGRHANYRIIDCFRALEDALRHTDAVENVTVNGELVPIVNEEWSPVVAGMMHRLFNPDMWPDDKGAVWDRHIPEFIQKLMLHSGVKVSEIRSDRATAVGEPVKIAASELNT